MNWAWTPEPPGAVWLGPGVRAYRWRGPRSTPRARALRPRRRAAGVPSSPGNIENPRALGTRGYWRAPGTSRRSPRQLRGPSWPADNPPPRQPGLPAQPGPGSRPEPRDAGWAGRRLFPEPRSLNRRVPGRPSRAGSETGTPTRWPEGLAKGAAPTAARAADPRQAASATRSAR